MHLTQKLGEIAAAAEKMRDCGDNSAIGEGEPVQDIGKSTWVEDTSELFKCYIFLPKAFCGSRLSFGWIWNLDVQW